MGLRCLPDTTARSSKEEPTHGKQPTAPNRKGPAPQAAPCATHPPVIDTRESRSRGDRALPIEARRPTPKTPATVVDVELRHYVADESDDEGTWVAEWGWRDSSKGVEDSSNDVTDLIQTVVDDVAAWS